MNGVALWQATAEAQHSASLQPLALNALSDDSPTESHATPSKSRALQQYEESPTFGILQLVPVKTACRPCLNSFASPQGAVCRRCRPCRHHAAGLLALRLQGWPASSSKEAGGGLLGPGDGHLASVETLALSWQSDRPPLLPQNESTISRFQSKPDRALLGPLPAHAKHAGGAAEEARGAHETRICIQSNCLSRLWGASGPASQPDRPLRGCCSNASSGCGPDQRSFRGARATTVRRAASVTLQQLQPSAAAASRAA